MNPLFEIITIINRHSLNFYFEHLENCLDKAVTEGKLEYLVEFVKKLIFFDLHTPGGEKMIKKWIDYLYTTIVFSGEEEKRHKFIELSVSRLTPLEKATTLALLWIYTQSRERHEWYPELIGDFIKAYQQKPRDKRTFLDILAAEPIPESLRYCLSLSSVCGQTYENS